MPTALVLLVAGTLAMATAFAPPASDLTITGTVTADGRALEGANVSVDGTAIGTSTDADGRFSLAGVPDDAEALRVTAAGFAPRVEPLRGRRSLAVTLTEVPDEMSVTGPDIGRADDMSYSVGPPPPPAAPVSPSGAPMTERSAEAPAASARSSEAAADETAEARTTPERRRTPRPRPGLLTAGDVDDGLNWDAFLRYVRRALDRQTGGGDLPALDLDDRLTLTVVDASGRPVAGARVRIEAEGGRRARRLVTETGTDGQLALFPAYDFGRGVRRLRVTASAPGAPDVATSATLQRLDGDRSTRLALPSRRAARPNALDLAFVIDVTGSMGDELTYLTREFETIVRRVESRYRGVDLRFGLVAYRDQGDAFVVRRWDFTSSAREMQQRLASLHAGGGGDYPEAMDEALDATLDLDWRTGTAARVAFLVADAPPHDYAYEATMDHVREARARGLRLYPLAASGVADEAEYLMRSAAVLTQARHLFLTDDSGVGNPHAEPRVPCYDVTALNDLLVRVIAGELSGRRVEPDPQEIVRSVGAPVGGVCQSEPAVWQRDRQGPRRRGGELGYGR